MLYNYQAIKALHLELTSKCNAGCPQCLRYTEGTVKDSIMPLHTMTLDEFKQVFPDEFIQQLHTVTLCGNYGDSLMATSLLDVCRHMKQLNPALYIELHTNGGKATDHEVWIELAKLLSLCIFAVDGLSDTNHIYRRNVDWPTLMLNIVYFIAAGGNAEWHYLVFKHNEHQVEQAERLSKLLGFKHFRPKFTDRFLNMRTGKVSNQFKILAPVKGKKELLGVLEPPDNVAYRNRVTEKMASVKDYDTYLAEADVVCQAATLSSIYVSSTGLVFPCCWIGYYSAYIGANDIAYDELLSALDLAGGPEAFNAFKHPIKEIVDSQFFEDLGYNGETSKGSQRLRVCAAACNTDNVCDAITDWVPAWKRE